MTAPADSALHIVKTRMQPPVWRVLVALPLRDVRLGDQIAVEVDLDLAADDLDFLEVPHARPAYVAAAAREVFVLAPDLLVDVVTPTRHNAVDRTRVLIGLQLVLLRRLVVIGTAAVIQELQLAHAVVGRVDLRVRHADAETVVAVLGHHEVKAENEVAVFLRRDEVARLSGHLAVGKARENRHHVRRAVVELHRQVLDAVHAGRSFPTCQVLAVEEGHEALVDRLRILVASANTAATCERQATGHHQQLLRHFRFLLFLATNYLLPTTC